MANLGFPMTNLVNETTMGLTMGSTMTTNSLCLRVEVYVPPLEMRIVVVDGEMAVFVQIRVFICGISIWDGDPR
ncbi:hypothetical protein EJB05_16767, partial [Eragrostis curvula]